MEGYDFVIVGGGSAGCVLAARLSEDPAARVLLLEAGGSDRHPFYHLPAGFAKMTKGIGSWGWSTVPQRHMNGMAIRYTQGKVIGGGSAINAQIYTRGNALDYDEWRQMGCAGWSYEDVLPYFRKAEDNDTWENRWHGKGGPLGVSRPRAPLPICEAYFAAAAELGIPRNHDMAGERQDGVGYYQLTQRNARRSSAAMAYLAPNRGRPNLTVRTGAQVRRIVVENARATGIEMMDGGRIGAATEVILSSGAIGSPRILMLSGIGPADHLAEVGIRPVFDQPGVGANLQDHLDLFVVCELTGPHTYDRYAKPHWSAVAGVRYLLTRGGPVASSLFETGGFWYADSDARSPDIQLHLGLGSGIEAGVAAMPKGGVTLNSAYLRPRSRGTVRLASADPGGGAADRPELLGGRARPRALDRGLEARAGDHARRSRWSPTSSPSGCRGRRSGPTRTISTTPAGTPRPTTTRRAPAGWGPIRRRWSIRGCASTASSGCGSSTPRSCRRVVSSNTNAATIMIAEKAADMIRADHGGREDVRGKRPTIVDVARAAGVSKSTVSLVLQNSPLVRPSTREEVAKAMAALGYVYNRSAANLRGADVGLIGLVINDLRNPFFTEFAASAQMTFARRGYATVIANTDESPAIQAQVVASMIEHGVSGFLISPAYVDEPEGLEAVRRAGVPAMQVLRRIDARTDAFPFASLDYAAGGRLAAEHLLGLGLRRIAFVGGLENRPVTEERMAGYRAVMAAAGLEAVAFHGRPSRAFGRDMALGCTPSARRSRPRSASPTSSRSGCWRASRRPGVRVGADFRLVGFDDIEECALTWPQLSSVRCDIARFGREAAEAMLAWIEGGERPPETRRAPVELIARHSSVGLQD